MQQEVLESVTIAIIVFYSLTYIKEEKLSGSKHALSQLGCENRPLSSVSCVEEEKTGITGKPLI